MMINSTPSPSATKFLSNSSTKPPISSLPSNPFLKFNNFHLKIAPISIRKTPTITTKASASTTANETLYDLLGVSENGTLSDIKKAYKQLALKYHPDVSPPDRAEEYTVRFIQVREAYETLSDPEARSVYDRCMAKGLHVACSGKSGTRFDPGSEDKRWWRETWEGQISELMRRSRVKVKPQKVDPVGGMSWAARIRKQRGKSCVNGSDQDQ